MKLTPFFFIRGILILSILKVNLGFAALIDRGNGLIYDDVLDVTWLQDANYAHTSGYDLDGNMSWEESNQWAENLEYAGFSDWRLTNIYDIDQDGCNFSFTGDTDCGYNSLTQYTDPTGKSYFSELAYMFAVNLNNTSLYDLQGIKWQAGWNNLNTTFTDQYSGEEKEFKNLQRKVYWSDTEYSVDSNKAWVFGFNNGFQGGNNKSINHLAWAVRDGDSLNQRNLSLKVSEPFTPSLILVAVLFLIGHRLKLAQIQPLTEAPAVN